VTPPAAGSFPFVSDGNVAIHVTDLSQARAFYGDVLSFRLVEEKETQLVYHTGVFTLYVNQDDKVIPYVPAFVVPSYDEARQRLIDNGCQILREWSDFRALYFSDPFGIVADVIEKKPA
jgi:catechol 2,3-dioxygenase-like lactoylglutathione lyase family enzyme